MINKEIIKQMVILVSGPHKWMMISLFATGITSHFMEADSVSPYIAAACSLAMFSFAVNFLIIVYRFYKNF